MITQLLQSVSTATSTSVRSVQLIMRDDECYVITKIVKLATLAELKEGGAKQLERKRYCSDHEGEELKLYCRTCQEVICRDCTIVTHKQHDYTFIKDVREELVQEMQDLLGHVEGKVEEFTCHQNHLQEIDRKSKKSVDACSNRDCNLVTNILVRRRYTGNREFFTTCPDTVHCLHLQWSQLATH